MKAVEDQEQLLFAALADSTRRRLVERMAGVEYITATVLAEELPISRQGITKHLKILEKAGMVASRQVGRETQYSLTPKPLADASLWVAAVTEQWQKRLQALFDYLAEDEGSS